MTPKSSGVGLCALLLVAAASAGEVTRMAAPARLGAAETKGWTHFQIVDWNGDGARDIVQRVSKDRGWVLINRGTDREPWFELPSRFPVNQSEVEPQEADYVSDEWIADFDGNGTPDILSVNQFSVHLSLNAGPGRHNDFTGKAAGFRAKVPPVWNADQHTPRWLFAADLDGDGRQEVVVYDLKLGLRAYQQSFEGKAFQLGESFEIKDTNGKSVCARCCYPVDFDGDGVLDIAGMDATRAIVIHVGAKGSKGQTVNPAIAAVDEAGKPIPTGNDIGVLDWNLDGLVDLLVLDDSGVLRCHLGREKGRPVFAAQGTPIAGNAFAGACEVYMPCLYDLDKDGRSDLLLKAHFNVRCGSSEHYARFHRNVLGAGPTVFGPGALIAGGPQSAPLNIGDAWAGDPALCDLDGDGKLDVVFWRPKGKDAEFCVLRGETKESPLAPFRKPAEVLFSQPWGVAGANYPTTRPCPVDWNGDGLVDLVIGAGTANGARVFLVLNEGPAATPKFAAPVMMTAGDKPLDYGSTVCVADWDRDGRPDVLGQTPSPNPTLIAPVTWCRNLNGSAQLAAGSEIRCAIPGGKFRKFSAGDIDGDGVTDLVVAVEYFNGYMCLSEGQLWWLRGVPPGAPARIADLTVRDAAEDGVTLAWTAPAGAARVEVRYSPWPIDEAAWFRAAPVKEAPKDGALTVRGIEKGRIWHFAACSFGPDGKRSEVSNCAAAATRPLVLATIPASAAAGGKGLPSGNAGLQFSLATLKGKTVRRATLTLSTASGGRVSCDKLIVCREAAAAEGPALPDLYAEPLLGRKEWDTTEALRRLLKAGEAALSVRLSGGPQDVVFAGPEAADPAVRPCLTVVLEEAR